MRIPRSLHASLLLPLLLMAVPCKAQPPLIRRDARMEVFGVPTNDPAMSAAIARARETLPVFQGYLQGAPREPAEVKLKAEFRQGDVVEHMWLVRVTFDGRIYRGVLESTPIDLTNVSRGDEVRVRPDRVSDWMVDLDGVMLGNFTLMEIRRRLSAKERTRMDRGMGYRILADTAITALPQRE